MAVLATTAFGKPHLAVVPPHTRLHLQTYGGPFFNPVQHANTEQNKINEQDGQQQSLLDLMAQHGYYQNANRQQFPNTAYNPAGLNWFQANTGHLPQQQANQLYPLYQPYQPYQPYPGFNTGVTQPPPVSQTTQEDPQDTPNQATTSKPSTSANQKKQKPAAQRSNSPYPPMYPAFPYSYNSMYGANSLYGGYPFQYYAPQAFGYSFPMMPQQPIGAESQDQEVAEKPAEEGTEAEATVNDEPAPEGEAPASD